MIHFANSSSWPTEYSSAETLLNLTGSKVTFGAMVVSEPGSFPQDEQGCQISLAAAYQNGNNLPDGQKIYPMTRKYTKWP
jgi:hypothetical protein